MFRVVFCFATRCFFIICVILDIYTSFLLKSITDNIASPNRPAQMFWPLCLTDERESPQEA